MHFKSLTTGTTTTTGPALPAEKTDAENKLTESGGSGASSPSTLFTNVSPFSFQKVTKLHAPISIPPAPHHLKLNNKRLNNTNFLKHAATAPGAASSPSSGAVSVSPTVVNTAVSSSTSPFSFSRVSVDNRPKSLLVSGLESSQDKAHIISFINSLGCQIENVCDQAESSSNGNPPEAEAAATTWAKSFVINFMARKDAEVVHYFDLF